MIQDIKHEKEENKKTLNTVPKPFPKRRKKNKPTGIHWFDDPHSTVKGETALWIAVITQAMMDALSRSGNPEMRYHKDEAIRWLTGNSKDFIEVCFYAGLDPDYVRRKAKKSLLSPVAWRAAPGKGKRYMERRRKRERLSAHSAYPKQEAPIEDSSSKECQVIAGPWQVFAN